MNGITRAIEIAGSQNELAELIGITQPAVSQWLADGVVPPSRVMAVYLACRGEVSPHDLNPVIYPDPDYRPSPASVVLS